MHSLIHSELNDIARHRPPRLVMIVIDGYSGSNSYCMVPSKRGVIARKFIAHELWRGTGELLHEKLLHEKL